MDPFDLRRRHEVEIDRNMVEDARLRSLARRGLLLDDTTSTDI